MNGLELEQSYQLINDRRQFIPENYESYACISTGADIDLREWFELVASSYSSRLPLWKFSVRDKIIYPKEPISLSITKGDTLYFAENETLGIFATGESRDAAIEDFAEQVLYFYEYYKAMSWDKVIGEARRLKEIYSDHFKEEEV